MSTGVIKETSLGKTLVAVLQSWAQETPSAKVYTWLADGDRESACLSYSDLDRRARAIAAQLSALQGKGTRALLLYKPGLEFIEALFGCLYAGIIAVPAYVPASSREFPRIEGMLRDADCSLVLTTSGSLDDARELVARTAAKAQSVATDLIEDEFSQHWTDCGAKPGDIAYLQYTSGSTSDPKGVMVMHANVIANLKYIAANGGFDETSVSVNWLPHFHDMGLIYGNC